MEVLTDVNIFLSKNYSYLESEVSLIFGQSNGFPEQKRKINLISELVQKAGYHFSHSDRKIMDWISEILHFHIEINGSNFSELGRYTSIIHIRNS